MAVYFDKNPDFFLWIEALGEGLQLGSYSAVVEGGLPEIKRKVGAPDVDGCGS